MTTNNWFYVPYPLKDKKIKVFCFPHAGGNAYFFRDWGVKFAPSAEIIGINFPGRSTHFYAAPINEMGKLVCELIKVLIPLISDGSPYIFLGHSLGALVAYETALKIRMLSLPMPKQLILSSYKAPHIRYTDELISNLSNIEIANNLSKKYGYFDQEIINNEALLKFVMVALRADIMIHESYNYKASSPLDIPFYIYGGSEDYHISSESLREWKRHTLSLFSLHEIEGNHFFLFENNKVYLDHIKKHVIE